MGCACGYVVLAVYFGGGRFEAFGVLYTPHGLLKDCVFLIILHVDGDTIFSQCLAYPGPYKA
jgi:hypothetical protein